MHQVGIVNAFYRLCSNAVVGGGSWGRGLAGFVHCMLFVALFFLLCHRHCRVSLLCVVCLFRFMLVALSMRDEFCSCGVALKCSPLLRRRRHRSLCFALLSGFLLNIYLEDFVADRCLMSLIARRTTLGRVMSESSNTNASRRFFYISCLIIRHDHRSICGLVIAV